MKTLETTRLLLREWQLSDAGDLYAYASGAKVGPMAGWKPHESLDESKDIIRLFIKENETWAIELKESHRVIGSVGLHKRKRSGFDGERELGYVLSEEYWGQGIMPEAARRVIQYAFEEEGLSCLNVSHFDFNSQSRRVIEKLGFTHTGHLEKSWKRYDGKELDEEVYELKNPGLSQEIGLPGNSRQSLQEIKELSKKTKAFYPALVLFISCFVCVTCKPYFSDKPEFTFLDSSFLIVPGSSVSYFLPAAFLLRSCPW